VTLLESSKNNPSVLNDVNATAGNTTEITCPNDPWKKILCNRLASENSKKLDN
jgi:hypothetical protein